MNSSFQSRVGSRGRAISVDCASMGANKIILAVCARARAGGRHGSSSRNHPGLKAWVHFASLVARGCTFWVHLCLGLACISRFFFVKFRPSIEDFFAKFSPFFLCFTKFWRFFSDHQSTTKISSKFRRNFDEIVVKFRVNFEFSKISSKFRRKWELNFNEILKSN